MILIGALNYLTRRTMALNLDINLYGFFYSVFSLAMLIIAFVDLGFNKSATILIAKHLTTDKQDKKKSIFWSILLIKLIIGTLSAICLFLLGDFLIKNYFLFPAGKPILFLFCLFIIATACSGLITATLDGFKEYTLKSSLQIGGALIVLLGIYNFIGSSPFYVPVISYIIAATAIFSVGIIYLMKFKNLNYPAMNYVTLKTSIKECWHLGKWIALATVGMSTMYYMDTIMLTYMSDLESVGLYNIALPIMQIYQSMLIFPIVLTPIASELWHKGERDQLKLLLKKINLAALFLLFCGSGVIFLTPLNFYMIKILFSANFIAAYSALNILCLGMLILTVGQLYSTSLMAIGKSQTVAIINIVAALFNILANIILIPLYNISGAALATALSYILLTVCCIWSFKKIP